MVATATIWQRDPVRGFVLFDADGFPLAVPQADAKTFGDMKTRVKYETLGPATMDDVTNAIQDAIAAFDQEQFWFSDIRYFAPLGSGGSQLNTSRGKEYYSWQDLPSLVNMPHIRHVSVYAFGNRYELFPRTPQWFARQSINPNWNALPTDWCWEAGALRLYPIPNDTYPLIVLGTMRFRPPTTDADTSPWFVEGEQLIRAEAKRLLFTNIDRDADQAAAMVGEIYGMPQMGRQGILGLLRRETTRRAGGPGRIQHSRGYL